MKKKYRYIDSLFLAEVTAYEDYSRAEDDEYKHVGPYFIWTTL